MTNTFLNYCLLQLRTYTQRSGVGLFLAVTLLFNLGCEEVERVYSNKKAISAMEAGDSAAAEKEFLSMIVSQNKDPLLNLNLGLNYEIAKGYEQSKAEYSSVVEREDVPPEYLFFAQFNLANVLVALKNIDQALVHYQAALDIAYQNKLNPLYIKEVKNNIELLMQGSGQGEGDGEGGGSGNNNKKPDDQSGQGGEQNDKPQEKFKSEKLTPEDVRKILEELKAQEKKIRAQEKDGQSKEAVTGNDW